MTGPIPPGVLATIVRAGLVLPRPPFPGQPWRPRTEAEVHLLRQARQMDRARQVLLGEVGRLRKVLVDHHVADRRQLAGQCPLTPQQLETLAAAAAGETLGETALRLIVSVDTLKSRRSRIVKLLGARDLSHAVALAMAAGWLTAQDVTGGGAP